LSIKQYFGAVWHEPSNDLRKCWACSKIYLKKISLSKKRRNHIFNKNNIWRKTFFMLFVFLLEKYRKVLTIGRQKNIGYFLYGKPFKGWSNIKRLAAIISLSLRGNCYLLLSSLNICRENCFRIKQLTL